ncbi:hypothetical protein BmR1_04g07365 [Babesia microti strain RI]|uniref:Uncharacterized protein n=1 Tax=Babesia microti (strain RI) TaxID=1133968 RepID=I7I9U8_BABMR|nr:hypothetical protein BmR1_04g07365 [Babesia microti strain RI]CCF75664.1 hypothetical protein BmR1_04g07365 [Babesia microti strain RI]|eukprot:XP_012650072.1 hypothetical protein BmR1_04g07365 [Babesia microti strain RI]
MGDLESGLSQEQRSHLISGYKNVRDGSLHIYNSARLASETEETAATVLKELTTQREVINRTRHSLVNISEIHEEAQGLIHDINRGDFVNKLVLYGIIVLETIAIFSIFISKIIKR